MRAILVAGMMLAAGAAAAQGQPKKTVVDAVASATAGAAWCGAEIDKAAVERHLAAAGFKRDDESDVRSLDAAFQRESGFWQVYGQGASMSEQGKPVLAARCAQLLTAYGPDGVIRKGLLSKK